MRNIYQRLSSLLLLLMAILALPPTLMAQINFQDNFDYPTGDLYKQGGWVKYASNPNSPIQVVDKALSYEGYPGGVKGKSVQVGAETSGQDLWVRFDPNDDGVKSGNVYYSALIKVTALPSTQKATAQTYVMSLLPRTKASVVADGKSSTELGRLFIVATADGKYQYGVDRGAAKPIMANGKFELGTTQLIVVKYAIATDETPYDIAALYVNPTSFDKEPTTPDATTDANTTGSKLGSYGLQGFELRQGANASYKNAAYMVGMLRIADTYAGLFSQQSGGGSTEDTTPQITYNASDLDLGSVLNNVPINKSITLKGKNLKNDVTVSISGQELTTTVQTLSANELMSSEGAQLPLTLNAQAAETGQYSATITLTLADGVEQKLQVNWMAVASTNVTTLRALSLKNEEDYGSYRYTGKATITFIDKAANPQLIYVQDITAGGIIKVNEDYAALAANLKVGDKITNLTGMVENGYGGITYFVPYGLQDAWGEVISSNNVVEPQVVTLAELKENATDYFNRLVCIKNATITSTNETFAEGMAQPTITDGTETGKLRIFKQTSLIGTTIPTEPVHITGLSTSTAAIIIAPRNADDVVAAATQAPELTITPTQFEQKGGTVGKTSTYATLHISTKAMPATTTLEITGAGKNMFSLSAESIAAGSAETDIVISYSPTAIGKHSARVLIDCPEVPDLSQGIALSAYAIDEQNPPLVKIDAESIPTFTAKVGETQEFKVNVTTAHLPDYVKAKVSETGVFRISNSLLMKDAVTPLTITFAPKEAGDFSTNIVFSSLGIDDVIIPLKGHATDKTVEPTKEGDDLPLVSTSPVTLLNEGFNSVERNKPLKLEGWKNLAQQGTRAWWGYTFGNNDESVGEYVAKATAYDSQVLEGNETSVEMLLVTPALDFKNAASKIFTFRVRGDYLQDNQTDKLELVYIDTENGNMYIAPVDGFTMPCTKDESGEWFEYHIDLTDQNIADTFFMGFRFTSTRGRNNSATYYIDDVTFGRTDIPVIRPDVTELAFVASQGKDETSDIVNVTTENLTEPIKLTLGGANKSKFTLSTQELNAEGGNFFVQFNSDDLGVHEAYVKLASRGAADKYIALTVNNTTETGISALGSATADFTVYTTAGVRVSGGKSITATKAIEGLAPGVYVVQKYENGHITSNKILLK